MAAYPQDPVMLLSMVNMKLRDRYTSLDALCEDWGVRRSEIEEVLRTIDYQYDPEQNAFI